MAVRICIAADICMSMGGLAVDVVGKIWLPVFCFLLNRATRPYVTVVVIRDEGSDHVME